MALENPGSHRLRRVLVLCPYPQHRAPSQRLKYEQYFDYLSRHGFQIQVSPFMTLPMWEVVYQPGRWPLKAFWTLVGYLQRGFDLVRTPFYDGIYVHLWVTPFGSGWAERLFRRLSRRLVYDIDDLVYQLAENPHHRGLNRFKSPQKYFALMKMADHVVTCTPYLDEVVRRHNPHTTDISSTINTDVYRRVESHDTKLVLGWSGSFSTSPYLKSLGPALRELSRTLDFKLLVIGDPKFEMEGVEVEAIPWREATEVADLSRIDIGLYPLPDEPWVYGKSGLKALQYMALGIPTVASAIGTNFRVIEDGVSGFLVEEQQWVSRLEQLAADPELRRGIGQAARERVERYYSVKANRDTYLEIFRRTFGEP